MWQPPRWSLRVAFLYCLLFSWVSANAFAEGPTDSLTWMQLEKIRGAYFGISQPAIHLQHLKDAGFNAALIKYGEFQALRKIEEWAIQAKQADIRFFPVINFAGPAEVQTLGSTFERAVAYDGTVLDKTPSPLDPIYWKKAILERVEAIARLSLQVPIAAVLIDMEMYGANQTVYLELDMSDGAFCGFVASRGEPCSVPMAQRRNWLVERHLTSAYEDYLRGKVQEYATEIRNAVDRINPNLTLGFLHILPNLQNWFYSGLAAGLGTPQKPVLVFDESTYVQGYSSLITRWIKELQEKPYVAYVPGLWISHFVPEDMAIHAYHLSVNTAGWWLYTSSSLEIPFEKLEDGYRIARPAEEYWQRLTVAHEELDRYIQNGSGYQSTLVMKPRTQIMLPIEIPASLRIPPLLPLSPGLGALPTYSTPPSRLRGKGTLFIQVTDDEALMVYLQHQPVGQSAQGASYVVVGPEGQEITRGIVGSGQRCLIHEKVPAGVYAFLFNAGSTAVEPIVHNRYYVYQATQEAPFSIIHQVRPLWFFVPPMTRQFGIHVKTTGPSEIARMVVRNPLGDIVFDQVITQDELHTFQNPGLSGAWQLEFAKGPTGIFEDVERVYFTGLVPPYLSDHPDRLLVPEVWAPQR